MEVVRYSLIGAQDIRFGTGTFEVTLADGRVIILEAVNAGHLSGQSAVVDGETVDDTMVDVYRARRGLTGLLDFDQDDATTTGLTWGYTNGMAGDGTGAVAAGTLALTANSTNYVEWDPETGVIAVNTSAFSPTDKVPIRKLITNATAITTNTDVRPIWRQNVNLLHGQCYLSWVSTSSVKLLPLNGNRIIINGTTQTIPAAGVALSNAGLTVSTTYYLYAYMNGSTMTLEAATTANTTSATDGIQIKTGDQTRTYVGAIEVDGSGLFRDNIRQWFRTTRDNAVTGLLQTAKGADVVSAGVPAFLSDGNYFAVTGTTTITDLPLWQAGTLLLTRFTGALSVTHNASKIILQGAQDYTTTAGDVLGFLSNGAGLWYELFRSRAVRGPTIQVFVTPGTPTYTKPAGLVAAITIVVGGGGGGGGTAANGAGGGGGGGTSLELLAGSAIGTTETVTVGAGGAAGATGGANTGVTGGTSSFGSLSSATGGVGGGGGSAGAGGAGGAGANGSLNFNGSAGQAGSSGENIGGSGGGAFLGGGGAGAAAAGSAGANYGGGGAGASAVGTAAGAGAGGAVVVLEFY